MSLYDRQKTLNLNTNKRICLIGCGGIGFWVAKYLSMTGIKKLYLYDNDILEEHNFNRLDLPEKLIGRNKAEITKLTIKNIRPECSVISYPYIFTETHGNLLGDSVDILVDCTDKLKSQENNERIAKNNNWKYIKSGYDGEHISIHNAVASWGESEDGYQIIPSFVVPAVIVAALTVQKIVNDKCNNKELSIDIKNIYNINY